jgi:hypothetical protein
MGVARGHCITMMMAIEEVESGKFLMYFTPTRPKRGEFYSVTGNSTNIKGFLDDFRKSFGEGTFGEELLTREQCQEFMDQGGTSFSFKKID